VPDEHHPLALAQGWCQTPLRFLEPESMVIDQTAGRERLAGESSISPQGRPVRRLPPKVRRFYAGFSYQLQI
jgi:hypothetical protein